MSTAGRMIQKGDWKKSIQLVNQYGQTAHKAIDMAVYQEALHYLALVNREFVKGGTVKRWDRLNKITLAIRRSGESGSASKGTKPLIKSGSLRRSLNVRKEGYGEYFVGVHRTAKRTGYNATKRPLVDIARVHEYGHTIVVKPEIRRYFMYLFLKGIIKAPLKKSTRVLVIPQRSYMNQAMDAWRGGHEVRLMQRVAQNMGLIKGAVGKVKGGRANSGDARGSGGSSASSGSIGG